MASIDEAKEVYGQIGVDVDKAVETLKNVRISMHCWQGDDVLGFDSDKLTGGISTTGNYPGRAGNPEELMAGIDKALSLMSFASSLIRISCARAASSAVAASAASCASSRR